jgi:hypothetical protein
VAKGAFGGQSQFVTEPFIEDIVKEIHAGIHVKPSMVVHDLMPHYISHCGPLRVTGYIFHIVDVLKQVITHGKFFLSNVLFAPDIELEIGVQFLVKFKYLLLSGRHLALYPNDVHLFWYQGRLFPVVKGFILIPRVVDCKLAHRNAILNEVVSIESHRIGIQLEDIAFDLLFIHLFPLVGDDDQVMIDDDAIRHVIKVGVGFDEPLHPLLVGDFSIIMFVGQVPYHNHEMFQKNKPVVEINSIMSSKFELRNYLVAI